MICNPNEELGRIMKTGVKKWCKLLLIPLLMAMILVLQEQLPAGSRLGRITGVMDEVVAVKGSALERFLIYRFRGPPRRKDKKGGEEGK